MHPYTPHGHETDCIQNLFLFLVYIKATAVGENLTKGIERRRDGYFAPDKNLPPNCSCEDARGK
ncbi:hypothetical protein Hanom_Chr17g01554151 [Helianthus anomalus]